MGLPNEIDTTTPEKEKKGGEGRRYRTREKEEDFSKSPRSLVIISIQGKAGILGKN